MTRPTYVLEVARFITDPEEWKVKRGKLEHVGYMRAIFRTKAAAVSYYDRHNPTMRSLNEHGTWQSDWDPRTHMLYTVREYRGLICTVPEFEEATGGVVEVYQVKQA